MIARIWQALRAVMVTEPARKLTSRVAQVYRNVLASFRSRLEVHGFRRRWMTQWRIMPFQGTRKTGLLKDVFGPLSSRELDWLYEKAVQAIDYGDIVELGSGEGQCSCCVALACLGSRGLLHSIWSVDILDYGSAQARRFVVWHKNVIRKGLVPFVRPATDFGCLSGVQVAMVLFGPSATLSDVRLVATQFPDMPRLIVSFKQELLQKLTDREIRTYGQLKYLG